MINTFKHLSYILRIKQPVIEDVIQNIDKHYYKKIEIKLNKDGTPKLDKDGIPKQRILYPSIGELKLIQKRINQRVLSSIQMPDYAYGAIKGRDNIKNAKCHQGKKFIFTTDMQDFFPSISNRMVFNLFRSLNFSPHISRILTQLTTYKGMLPQGAPTSSKIANLAFVKAGNEIVEFSKKNNITFTSFVDDLTFSSPLDFKNKVDKILHIIKSEGFKISHKKTFYKTRFPLVTGLIVKNNSIDVTDEYKKELDKSYTMQESQKNGKIGYVRRVLNTNKKNNKEKIETS